MQNENDLQQAGGDSGDPPSEVHVVVSVQPEEKRAPRQVYQERRSGRIPSRKRSVPFKFRYLSMHYIFIKSLLKNVHIHVSKNVQISKKVMYPDFHYCVLGLQGLQKS